MTNYKLLYFKEKAKGVQVHLYETKEDCIRMLYLDYETLTPLNNQCCSDELLNYVNTQKSKIGANLNESVAV